MAALVLERLTAVEDEAFDDVGPAMLDSLLAMLAGDGTDDARRQAGAAMEKLLTWQANR